MEAERATTSSDLPACYHRPHSPRLPPSHSEENLRSTAGFRHLQSHSKEQQQTGFRAVTQQCVNTAKQKFSIRNCTSVKKTQNNMQIFRAKRGEVRGFVPDSSFQLFLKPVIRKPQRRLHHRKPTVKDHRKTKKTRTKPGTFRSPGSLLAKCKC